MLFPGWQTKFIAVLIHESVTIAQLPPDLELINESVQRLPLSQYSSRTLLPYLIEFVHARYGPWFCSNSFCCHGNCNYDTYLSYWSLVWFRFSTRGHSKCSNNTPLFLNVKLAERMARWWTTLTWLEFHYHRISKLHCATLLTNLLRRYRDTKLIVHVSIVSKTNRVRNPI